MPQQLTAHIARVMEYPMNYNLLLLFIYRVEQIVVAYHHASEK